MDEKHAIRGWGFWFGVIGGSATILTLVVTFLWVELSAKIKDDQWYLDDVEWNRKMLDRLEAIESKLNILVVELDEVAVQSRDHDTKIVQELEVLQSGNRTLHLEIGQVQGALRSREVSDIKDRLREIEERYGRHPQ